MRTLLSASTALLITIAAGTAFAQDSTRSGVNAGPAANSTSGRPDRGSNAASSSLPAADKRFVEDASQAGMLEVQAGKLAEQKAQRGDVKELARHLVQDHTMANDKLKAIAMKKGVTIGKDLTEENHAKFLKLRDAGKFDQAYLDDQMRAHQEAIALFQTQSSLGQDADLKAFAADTLPKLQQHLTMIEQLHAGPSASSGPAPQGALSGSTAGSSGSGSAAGSSASGVTKR